jgi:phosphate transport system protein
MIETTLSEHTAKAFDSDLHELIRMIAEMGGLVESQIRDAVDALTERNIELARRTIAADDAADLLQREIEGKAVVTIARRQPMAVDLREVVGILRIANDLERIGDLAKNIGRRAIALDGEPTPHRPIRGFRTMSALVLGQLRDVLDSFIERDLAKATSVWTRDEKIDAMYTSLFRELLTYMMEDPGTITFGIHLLFCAKNIERIGDHTTNIAEAVHYIIDGHSFATERPKADATSLMPVAFGAT